MNERVEVVAATTVGALVGGVAGYLLLTGSGRRLLAGLNAATVDALAAMQTVGRTLHTLEEIVNETRSAMESTRTAGGSRD